VLLPDVKRIVGEAVGALEGRMNAHFDAIYQRFDALETEYHMLVAGLKRVEERLDKASSSAWRNRTSRPSWPPSRYGSTASRVRSGFWKGVSAGSSFLLIRYAPAGKQA
jgi:hypothetical protein